MDKTPSIPCLLRTDAPHLNRVQRKHLALLSHRIEWLNEKIAAREALQQPFILFVRERAAIEFAIEYILGNPPK